MEYDGWYIGSERVHPSAITAQVMPPYAAFWGSAGPAGGSGSSGGDGGDEGIYEEVGVSAGGDARRLIPLAATTAAGDTTPPFTLDHQHTLNLQHTCPQVGGEERILPCDASCC